MDGFFVTINCSKIFDSNETSYKIFIDKNKMSVVYELVEWIRFMFSLKRCFFLIHENSVIHELEDIKVLELLNSLEMRPCLRSNCIHQKMEKNLLSKLNLFTYWNEMRVHKLFQARCSSIIQTVSQNQQNHLSIEETSTFSFQPHENFFVETDESKLANNQHTVTSPSTMTHNIENDESQVIEIMKKDIANEKQLNFKKVNGSINNKNTYSDEIKSPEEFFSRKLESVSYPNSNRLNPLSESSVSKKPKLQSESRKNKKKIGIPFSLGALLSDIREKAQIQELKEKQEIGQKGTLCSSVYSVGENAEDDNLHDKNTYIIHSENSLKRKRKRKHKKQNLKVDLSSAKINLSWDYFEPAISVKPNHIRFNDTDENTETETTENNSNSFDKKLVNFNSSEVSNNPTNVSQQMVHLTAEPILVTEKKEKNRNCLIKIEPHNESFENLIDHNTGSLNGVSQNDSETEKKELNDPQQNLLDLESLKQKIKPSRLCTRFY